MNSDQFFCSNARPQGSHPVSKKLKFLTPGLLLLAKKTQRMIKSPCHGQNCDVKSPSYAQPSPPPPPSGLALIGALDVVQRTQGIKYTNHHKSTLCATHVHALLFVPLSCEFFAHFFFALSTSITWAWGKSLSVSCGSRDRKKKKCITSDRIVFIRLKELSIEKETKVLDIA